MYIAMVEMYSNIEQINVLTCEANWAWPWAFENIFRPRGVNLLVAESPNDFVNVMKQKRIHAAIMDMDVKKPDCLATIRIVRMNQPGLPCILLSSEVCQRLLDRALQLDVFSVLDKPVDMELLRQQLDRLFVKRYGYNVFTDHE